MIKSEILSLEYMRKELVDKLASGPLSREDIDELHRLDKLVGGNDIVRMLFDEVNRLRSEIDHAINFSQCPATRLMLTEALKDHS